MGVKFLKKLYRRVGEGIFAKKIYKINQCSK